MGQFGWLQCAAIRNTDYLARFRALVDQAVPEQAVRNFMAVEYEAFALWCPSLVQHAEVTSSFFTETDTRISRSYKTAYG